MKIRQARIIAGMLVGLAVFGTGCSDEADDVFRPTQDPLLGSWTETYDYPLFDTVTQSRVDTVLTTELSFLSDSFDLKTYDEGDNVVYVNNGSYSIIRDTIVFNLNIPSDSEYKKKLNYELLSSRQLFISTGETSGFIWGASFGSNYYAISPKSNGLFTK